jgi:hypothetical protein
MGVKSLVSPDAEIRKGNAWSMSEILEVIGDRELLQQHYADDYERQRECWRVLSLKDDKSAKHLAKRFATLGRVTGLFVAGVNGGYIVAVYATAREAAEVITASNASIYSASEGIQRVAELRSRAQMTPMLEAWNWGVGRRRALLGTLAASSR